MVSSDKYLLIHPIAFEWHSQWWSNSKLAFKDSEPIYPDGSYDLRLLSRTNLEKFCQL